MAWKCGWVLAGLVVACGPDTMERSDETSGTSGGPNDSTTALGSEDDTAADDESAGPVTPICEPGEMRCLDDQTMEICAGTALEWETIPCEGGAVCLEDSCVSPCQLSDSTHGCAFVVQRPLPPYVDLPDAVVVVNTAAMETQVTLARVSPGSADLDPMEQTLLAPGESVSWDLYGDVGEPSSSLRQGGMYRIESQQPVAAFVHAAHLATAGNESALLLPEPLLGSSYVLPAWAPLQSNPDAPPTYFDAVIVGETSNVSWTPTAATQQTQWVAGVDAGGVGTYSDLGLYGTLRVVADAEDADLSGTLIESAEPFLVGGGTRCANAPGVDGNGFCDPLYEVLIPVEHWGRRYVAAPPPVRDSERHYWRIYAGAPTTIRTEPDVLDATSCPGIVDGACPLDEVGDWVGVDVPAGEAFTVEADEGQGPIMLVGYLASRVLGNDNSPESTEVGDAAMFQSIAAEAWLDHYLVVGTGEYDESLTIVRRVGGATVFLDGASVTGMTAVGEYEWVNVELPPGVATLESDEPFGLVQVGYGEHVRGESGCALQCSSGYAHPAGYRIPTLD